MRYSTTFVNQNTENNIVEAGRESLERKLEAFNFWMEHGTALEDYAYEGMTRRELLEEFDGDREQVREVESIIEEFKNGFGDFHEYGLSFDFVNAEDTEGGKGYYRYQVSWGGPSDELRFYPCGAIEYVYLDWFSGVGFNCNLCKTMEWVKEYFTDCGIVDFDSLDYEQLYYETEKETE